MGKSFAPHTKCSYFLIPSSWLARWKAYITTTGKNLSSVIEPENLGATICSLICKICEVCIEERESSELVQKLNYTDEDICVYLVHGKEAPRSIMEHSNALGRTSKRSKKTLHGSSMNFKVSGTTLVYQLKMMIWEAFGVVKENQKLCKGTVEIEGDSATLADKNIFPGDILWVVDSETYVNRDIADELSEQKMEPALAEEGFRGTLLSSAMHVQAFKEKSTDDSVL